VSVTIATDWQHPSVIALQRKGPETRLEAAFEPKETNEVWASIAIAVAEPLTDVSPVRLRECEACTVHLKKGSRRSCSMNICGNKIKVAAYQKRKRAAEKKMR
jgi:predicted RNA-binding Zn ribbon-like protein